MLNATKHLSMAELEAGLDNVRKSPLDNGRINLIVRRPESGKREIIEKGELHYNLGLIGDNWSTRGSSRTPDGQAHPEMQINIMNSRIIELIAGEKENWALAGDQFYVDLNLSDENIPAGTRLSFGSAILEVTAVPHTGCKKFTERFGIDAVKFVNSPIGKELHLRGINAKVVQAGYVSVGDIVSKI